MSYFIVKERKSESRRINVATIAKTTCRSSTIIRIHRNSSVLDKIVFSIILKNFLNFIDFELQKFSLYSFFLIKQRYAVLKLKQK